MNIWLVNPFDPMPSTNPLRYSYLVRLLAEAGHTVTWWTSQFTHTEKRYLTQAQIESENSRILPNGKIVATWTTSYNKHVSLRRLLNHVIWALTFFQAARRTSDTPDVIWVSSPTLTGAYFARKLAKERNARLVLDVVDLWPEAFALAIPARLKKIGGLLFNPLMRLESANFCGADALTAVSKTYLANALTRSGTKPSFVLPYGIDLDLFPAIPEKSPSEIKICYAGTLGPHHDIETFIKSAKMLESQSKLRFFIAGDGPQRAQLETFAHSLGLSNLVFLGWLDQVALKEFLVECHIGVLAVSLGSVISTPLKTFDYLAAGLALVSSVPGELQQFIQANDLGTYYEAGNASSLADAILHLADDPKTTIRIGQQSRRVVEADFDRKKNFLELIRFFKSLVV
jgi:glycosyltransferase involved in cell wall biosynthesis